MGIGIRLNAAKRPGYGIVEYFRKEYRICALIGSPVSLMFTSTFVLASRSTKPGELLHRLVAQLAWHKLVST